MNNKTVVLTPLFSPPHPDEVVPENVLLKECREELIQQYKRKIPNYFSGNVPRLLIHPLRTSLFDDDDYEEEIRRLNFDGKLESPRGGNFESPRGGKIESSRGGIFKSPRGSNDFEETLETIESLPELIAAANAIVNRPIEVVETVKRPSEKVLAFLKRFEHTPKDATTVATDETRDEDATKQVKVVETTDKPISKDREEGKDNERPSLSQEKKGYIEDWIDSCKFNETLRIDDSTSIETVDISSLSSASFLENRKEVGKEPPKMKQLKITAMLAPRTFAKKNSNVEKAVVEEKLTKRKTADDVIEPVPPATKKRKGTTVKGGSTKGVRQMSVKSCFTSVGSQKSSKEPFEQLNDGTCLEVEIGMRENPPVEICFNLHFKEGFCQLTQSNTIKKPTTTPVGVMIGVSRCLEGLSIADTAVFYYIDLDASRWNDFSTPRSLLRTCLSSDCRRICFRAQVLFTCLLNLFGYTDADVCKWRVLDPFVGCWMLDPDQAPSTFRGVLTMLNVTPDEEGSGVKECELLCRLGEVSKDMYACLRQRNLWNLYVDLEMRLVPIVSAMEHNGIAVDEKLVRSFGELVKEELVRIERRAHGSVGRSFQLNSTVQVRSILYDELKLDAQYSINVTETAARGAKSTSEPVMQQLNRVHPLPGLILEHRRLNKIRNNLVDPILGAINHATGTIHCSWEQTAAANGRIVCSNPNLQLIPKHPLPLSRSPPKNAAGDALQTTINLRSAFVARPKHSLLSADFLHLDLHVFAHLSQDDALISALQQRPTDLFLTLTKLWLPGRERMWEQNKDRTERIVNALVHGEGLPKLAEDLSLKLDETVIVVNQFTRRFPGFRSFARRVVEACRNQGYATSLSGRRRPFPNINSGEKHLRTQSERQAVSFCVQGSTADICKVALVAVQQRLSSEHPAIRARILLQYRDGILLEVEDDRVESVKRTVLEVLENSATFRWNSTNLAVPIPVIVAVGKNWADMASN